MTYQEQLIAESQRFHENLGKCWHELKTYVIGEGDFYEGASQYYDECNQCGKTGFPYKGGFLIPDNPTYDNPAVIRKKMGDKWEGFVDWHDDVNILYDADGYPRQPETRLSKANTLTDPLLLMQSANSYMEEK